MSADRSLVGALPWQRLTRAYATWPGLREWCWALVVLGVFGVVALPVAMGAGWASWGRVDLSWSFVGFALFAVVVPGLTEETVFRVFIIPGPREAGRRVWLWVVVSSVVFAAWHPLNGMLLLTQARGLFTDPTFVGVTFWLGLCCGWLYRRTGSIWPTLAVHWAVVVLWRGLFDGFSLIETVSG